MKPNPKNAAVFLDKDGTLIEDVPYNVDPRNIRLTEGAAQALAALQEAGFRLVVVSNQSGVARGIFEATALKEVESKLREVLKPWGVTLAGFYYCPHHPEGTVPAYRMECRCRKPAPGMLEQAAGDLNLDLKASWLVGDILDDVEAGNRASCRTILLNNGNETEWRPGPSRSPDHMASTLEEAARIVLAATGSSERMQVTR